MGKIRSMIAFFLLFVFLLWIAFTLFGKSPLLAAVLGALEVTIIDWARLYYRAER